MDHTIYYVIGAILYIVGAPFMGCLMDGAERKLSARMQGRIGPPILQPWYDFVKLLNKQVVTVDRAQFFILLSYLVLMIMSGAMFFSGNDLLMTFFVLSTTGTFLYFAAIVPSSPYSSMAASRELIQEVCYEPAVLLLSVGFYLATGTFNARAVFSQHTSLILFMPGFLASYLFAMIIKLRLSPFDVSTSHHAHQELVQGVTTEMGARNLAIFKMAEWYEMVFLYGVVMVFILNSSPLSILAAVLVDLAMFFCFVLIDNTNARVKWENMLGMSWTVTGLCSGVNLLILMMIR